jgi:DsbC/DsbD-like thiol-disulfide interchange protein/cytochrome c biogenesis protein CcdA
MSRVFISLLALLLAGAPAFAQLHEGLRLVRAELIAGSTAVAPGRPLLVALRMRMAPGWHTYWQFPGDSGMPTRIEWSLPAGWKAGPIQWPAPTTIDEEGLQTYAYSGEVLLFTELTPPAELRDPEVTLRAKASWLVCEKICIPGEASLSLTLPVAGAAEPANQELFARHQSRLPQPNPPFKTDWKRTEGQLILNISGAPPDARIEFFPLPPPNVLIGHPTVAGPTVSIPIQSGNASSLPGVLAVHEGATLRAWQIDSQAAVIKPAQSLGKFLAFGFIGGFLLNLMPCVLPVIALKIFGFIRQAGESRARILRLGLAFVAGIFAWFLGLAALVSAFKAAGHELNWSFQFQHPAFLIAMMVIVFVFALNLLGAFEVLLPGRATGALAEMSAREGYGGAFLHGMFATLMATPCTAPFLGPALGFAFAQSPAVIFGMFTSIAAGMAFPYLVLTAQPAWLRFIPKPGVWMVRVKQAMGLLLAGTFVWLAWIFWQQQTVRHEPFSPRLEHALTQGKTVFVDFTADWCVNCKVNERLVLNTEPVQRALRENDVIFLTADWTNGDEDITALLKKFGRAGVPAYVIFPKASPDQPVVLPELLTRDLVINALTEASR